MQMDVFGARLLSKFVLGPVGFLVAVCSAVVVADNGTGLPGGSMACPSACKCLGNFVDCSEKGLIEVPKDLPDWVEELDLKKNSIRSLETGCFASFKNLRTLDLSKNVLRDVGENVFGNLSVLQQLSLEDNELSELPYIGIGGRELLRLNLARNRIHSLNDTGLMPLVSLKFLDLSGNGVVDVALGSFPRALDRLNHLDLSDNQIVNVDRGAFGNLTRLSELKLARNSLRSLTKDFFFNVSRHLQRLDLSGNSIEVIEGLALQGLKDLQILRLTGNGIRTLGDGAFYGLGNLQELYLDSNNVTVVSKAWLYGLNSLRVLSLSSNAVALIRAGAWEECSNLQELNLSSNALRELGDEAFDHLAKLASLSLASNEISAIGDSAFAALKSLSSLDLNFNQLDWVIEDETSKGKIFSGLLNLTELGLRGNRIRSISSVAFAPLRTLRALDISLNPVASIQENPFGHMKLLTTLKLNTTSLLCDCAMKWFSPWLKRTELTHTGEVDAKCLLPESLRGIDIVNTNLDAATCADFPRLRIEEEPPNRLVGLAGSNISLTCRAVLAVDGAAILDDTIEFVWKKDKIPLDTRDHVVHLRRRRAISRGPDFSGSNSFLLDGEPDSPPEDGKPGAGGYPHAPGANGAELFQEVYERIADDGGLEKTSVLHLVNLSRSDSGKYQCVVSSGIGSLYSKKTRLLVYEMPRFTKLPKDVTTSLGQGAKLECEADGFPHPEVSWKKDGGRHFPAATERRMYRYPGDSDIFIMEVKLEDQGVYTCTANSSAGMISANATLTIREKPSFTEGSEAVKEKRVILGETAVIECRASGLPRPVVDWYLNDAPLEVTDRHMFAQDHQILLIIDTLRTDAGNYRCTLSNQMGKLSKETHLNIVAADKERDWATIMTVTISACSIVFIVVIFGLVIYLCRRLNVKQPLPAYPPRYGNPSNVFEMDAMLQQQQCHSNEYHQTLSPAATLRANNHVSRMPSMRNGYVGSPDPELEGEDCALVAHPGEEIPVPFGLSGVTTATVPDDPSLAAGAGSLASHDLDHDHERRQFGLMDDESDRASSKDSGTGTDSGANVSGNGSTSVGPCEARLSADYASAEEVLRSLRDSVFAAAARANSMNVLSNDGLEEKLARDREDEASCASPSPCPSPLLLMPAASGRPASSQMILQTFPHRRCESSASVNGPISPTRWSLPPSQDEDPTSCTNGVPGATVLPSPCGRNPHDERESRSQMTSPVFHGGGGRMGYGGPGGAYWGGHLKPSKYRRRAAGTNVPTSCAPSSTNGKSGMTLLLPRSDSASTGAGFSYGFGVSSPDLSQDHSMVANGGIYGDFLKPPPSTSSLGVNSGFHGGNATLKRGRLRASGTSLNSMTGGVIGSKGKLVECPTVPARSPVSEAAPGSTLPSTRSSTQMASP